MMSEIIVKVDNLYKKFTRSIRRSMYYGSIDISRSMLGIKYKTNNLRPGEFWALNDINLELKKGETLGIIGANGSGKSTLLRLLSGIFPPDAGTVQANGSLGALIAVGAGFHPHMSGRENIYLNGTILGMTKKEIDNKFNDIVDFSEIGDFLDAPVNTYSSGMRVRLGFSIAIHRVPDILLIDEILSVGDLSFRKKSGDKLLELSNRVSTIFISHNMRSVSRICDRVVLMHEGRIVKTGNTDEVILEYINYQDKSVSNIDNSKTITTDKIEDLSDINVEVLDSENNLSRFIQFSSACSIRLLFESKNSFSNEHSFTISLLTMDEIVITVFHSEFMISKGNNCLECIIESLRIVPGKYKIIISARSRAGGLILRAMAGVLVVLESGDNYLNSAGLYREDYTWNLIDY